MKSIDWSEDLLVNVDSIDAQHKELYVAMNAVLGAVNEKQPSRIVGYLIQAVAEHTATHCHDEEALMIKWDYPGIEPQKKDHDYFSRAIDSMKESLEKGNLSYDKLAEDLFKLAGFFSMHIRKLDSQLGRFINERPA
jgi:hemerythrin